MEKTDFVAYDATLTGSDTEQSWGALSKAVDKANKPILGLGEGGYSFFGGLKLDIGSPHGAHGPFPNAVPVNTTKSAFWTAIKMPIAEDQSTALYEKTNHIGIYLPKPADDVLLIAREDVGAKHFVMVQKGKRYVFWGFTGSPDQMTSIGKELFVATCKYTTSLK